MSRPSASREPGESKGPNAKKKRQRPKPANARRPGSAAKRRRSGTKVTRPRPLDPSDVPGAATRYLQPYEATKAYLCPGCQQIIPSGLGHMVVVPPDDPDLRRHWHRGCWLNRRRG